MDTTLRPDRDICLERLEAETFDVLVVGGGITGAGVAFDAASRGLRTALVERDDFASGTSSRSSKLVHGGLRYLQHLELGLVREALSERGVLRHMAPHLVTPLPFVVPRYGKRRLMAVEAGLNAYDMLAIGSGFPRHRRIDAPDLHHMASALKPETKGGLWYWDARTDDARLTWTVIRTAIAHGAACANHAEVTGFLRDASGRVRGAHVRADGRDIEVKATVVVNAAGVFADEVARLEDPDGAAGIRPSKGIHIVFAAARVPVNVALTIPAPDGRYIFVIPWPEDGVVIVGTTDEDYAGDVRHPRAEPDEIAFLIDTLNRVLDDPVKPDDLMSSYAGLRPLIQRPGEASKDLSRRHRVWTGSAGVVGITGGKLTTWRAMAEDTVDVVVQAFDHHPDSSTRQLHLWGGEIEPELPSILRDRARAAGVPEGNAERLYQRYGSGALAVLQGDPGRLHPELPYLRAEATYAVTHEMARTSDDLLSRRLRARMVSRDRGLGALPLAEQLLGRVGGREGSGDAYRADVEADLRSEAGG